MKIFKGNNQAPEWPALGGPNARPTPSVPQPPSNGWAALSYNNEQIGSNWPSLGEQGSTSKPRPTTTTVRSWAGVAGGGQQGSIAVPVGSTTARAPISGNTQQSWAGVAGQGQRPTMRTSTVRSGPRTSTRVSDKN